ncbi:pro-corazonin [Condylostylus longicornis]|uniref:pro-corazonin n=1 Tax=Condylostylus longicornis TaxID=2530218 RepID=UPI00244DC7C3|nr:pro-corazonin [Condylostylus longicornis]
MAKMIIVPLLLLSIAITCMGQTFQYSRGWTNGKRSNTHDGTFQDLIEIETEKKLEKCLYSLQRFIRNSYLKPSQLIMNNNKFQNGHHQSGEIIDDLIVPDNVDFNKH